MPTFDTPEPISATIDLMVGDVRLAASDRTDTAVEVRPSDEYNESDVRAAEQTRVEYEHGKLLVEGPKKRGLGLFGTVGSIDVAIDLPAGSAVQGHAAAGAFRCSGRLGECALKTATGNIQLDRSGPLRLSTAAGDIVVDYATGDVEVSTSSGAVRIREIDGAAVIKSSNGNSWIGRVTGDVRVKAANGAISVDRAAAAATAKTANGGVRIGEVGRGPVALETALGEVEVGIPTGTAAWLDVHSMVGSVRNDLDTSGPPDPSDRTVEVFARTGFGDIVIRRSAGLGAAR